MLCSVNARNQLWFRFVFRSRTELPCFDFVRADPQRLRFERRWDRIPVRNAITAQSKLDNSDHDISSISQSRYDRVSMFYCRKTDIPVSPHYGGGNRMSVFALYYFLFNLLIDFCSLSDNSYITIQVYGRTSDSSMIFEKNGTSFLLYDLIIDVFLKSRNS